MVGSGKARRVAQWWLEDCRASSGEVPAARRAGHQQASCRDDGGDQQPGRQVVRTDAVQAVGDQACQRHAEEHAGHDTGGGQQRTLAEHHALDITALRTQRHADAQLGGTTTHGEAEHGMEAEHHQQQRDRRECRNRFQRRAATGQRMRDGLGQRLVEGHHGIRKGSAHAIAHDIGKNRRISIDAGDQQ
jgi:hypothetical protein